MSDLPPDDRLRELLAERALFGLGEEELGELHSLSGGVPDEVDDLALAAAAADLAYHRQAVEEYALPDDLRQRILAATRQAAALPLGDIRPAGSQSAPTAPRAMRPREWMGWLAALAATLVAVLLANRGREVGESLDPQQLRAELLAFREQGDAKIVEIDWTPGEDPSAEGATGDVVWSDQQQRGVMRFRGLAANDPRQNQYQLWIFDADRDERFPVDGGVFDIPAGLREVLVPVRPRVRVTRATLFAISVEKPGGTVVSDRARLPLVAAVEPAAE